MTRDEIVNMPAGHKIDALIAAEVLGWTRPSTGMGWNVTTTLRRKTYDEQYLQVVWIGDGEWLPSSDISMAFEVLDTFTDYDLEKAGLNYHFTVGGVQATALTAPLAICRAILLTIMEKLHD